MRSRKAIALAFAVGMGLTNGAMADTTVPVTNGDFTAGLSGWTTGGAGTTSIGQNGFGTAATLVSDNQHPVVTLSQTLTNLVAGLYTVTFNARDNLNNANDYARFAGSISFGNLVQGINPLSVQQNIANTGTLTYVFDVTAAYLQSVGNQLALTFSFARTGNQGTKSMEIDNVAVSVAAVPGPLAGAGLVPLLLAGAAWFSRRRWTAV